MRTLAIAVCICVLPQVAQASYFDRMGASAPKRAPARPAPAKPKPKAQDTCALRPEICEVVPKLSRQLMDGTGTVVSGIHPIEFFHSEEEAPKTDDAAPTEQHAVESAPQEAAETAEPWHYPTRFDVRFGSAYAFRGASWFRDGQHPGGLVAPRLHVGLPHGFYGAWGAAFQLAGEHRRARVRSGFGNQQDLTLGWTGELGERVRISGELTTFVFAGGVEKEAGTDSPVWVQPGARIEADAGVTWVFSVAQFQGVQKGLAGRSYVYATAGARRTAVLHEYVSVRLGGQVGVKGWTRDESWRDNTLDVAADVAVPVTLERVSLAPMAQVVWTNTQDPAENSTFVWFGLDASLEFGAGE